MEEFQCRICRESSSTGRGLFFPCKCKGSIKYVHEECLLDWLRVSKRKQCEVCGYKYQFSQIYAVEAPEVLPLNDILAGVIIRCVKSLKVLVRLLAVLLVWLVMVPIVTSWVWRLCFARSTQEALLAIAIRACKLNLVLTDCVYGSFLSAAIVFVFLGTASLREYLRQFRFAHQHRAENNNLGQLINQNREQERRGDGAALGNHQGLHPINMNINQEEEQNAGGDVGGMPGGIDLDRMEDVPFEELVGIQGSLSSLIENATTILLSNLFFLVASVMLPFNIGRACMSVINIIGTNRTSKIPHMFPLEYFKSALNATRVSMNYEGYTPNSQDVPLMMRAASEFEAQLDPPLLGDILTLGSGYLAMLAFGAVFGFLFLFCRFFNFYRRTDRYSALSPQEMLLLVPLIAKRAYSYLVYSCVLLKVTFLLIVELGVFPLVFGLWLDLCSLPVFHAKAINRIQFALQAPITFTLIHWSCGILYMFFICVCVSALKGILKPGILTFLRDPADPNINPFRELFEEPLSRHVKRIILGSLIYGSAALILVYMPVQFVKVLFPDIYPVEMKMLDPISELPVHLLMIHFGIPLTVEYVRPKRIMKIVIHSWLRFMGRILNVHNTILQDTNASAGENGDNNHEATASAPIIQKTARVGDIRHLLRNGINVYKRSWNGFVTSPMSYDLRITLLVILSCLAIQLSNAFILSLPLLVGRMLCTSVGFPAHHDFYNISIGLYLLWVFSNMLLKLYKCTINNHFKFLPRVTKQDLAIVLKCVVLGVFWLVMIPTLVGVLVDLALVVPLTVPLNNSAMFFVYQQWAVGILCLKFFHKFVKMLPYNPDTPSHIRRWKSHFAKLEGEGVTGVGMSWAFVKVTWPVVSFLVLQICLPFIVTQTIMPAFGVESSICQCTYRYGYLLCVVLHQVMLWKPFLKSWLWKMHNAIRDDKYLVGKALRNLD